MRVSLKAVARLQAQTYKREKWLDEVAERARISCWQSRGYFRAVISPTPSTRDKYAVVLTVDEGSQYRLGHISFQNLKAVVSTHSLRPLVPLRDGDIFASDKITEGVENLRRAYADIGYINFSTNPNTEVDDEQRIINIRWDVSEGRPFFVRTINFDGVSPAIEDSLRSYLLLKPGNVYSRRLLETSFAKMRTLLPPGRGLNVEFTTNDELGVVDLRVRCVLDAGQK
jgi:outer membrane protein insertion porin family